MINDKAVQDFQIPRAIGVRRPRLAPDAFNNPQGAFDAMPPQLSQQVTRGLDALSRDSQRLVRDYLHKRLGRDQDPDAGEEEDIAKPGGPDIGAGDFGAQVVKLLEGAGVDPQIVERVKAMLAASNEGDGTLRLTHGDQEGATLLGGPSSGYDPASGTAGGLLTGDEPPAFQGAPRVGGYQVPLTAGADINRRLARDAARRQKISDASGSLHWAKDAPRPRKASRMAMDSASEALASYRNFVRRFPDAARLVR
jgi:hypothetical protein